MPRPKILNSIEEQALEHLVTTSSPEISKRAKILLELNKGEKYLKIVEKIGVSQALVIKWRKKWLSSNLTVDTWDEALAKANSVIGTETGRPKACKDGEISKIVELAEWNEKKNAKSSKQRHYLQVAEEASQFGLPQVSARTISRILDNHYQKVREG
jgi:hypothetical protein